MEIVLAKTGTFSIPPLIFAKLLETHKYDNAIYKNDKFKFFPDETQQALWYGYTYIPTFKDIGIVKDGWLINNYFFKNDKIRSDRLLIDYIKKSGELNTRYKILTIPNKPFIIVNKTKKELYIGERLYIDDVIYD